MQYRPMSQRDTLKSGWNWFVNQLQSNDTDALRTVSIFATDERHRA